MFLNVMILKMLLMIQDPKIQVFSRSAKIKELAKLGILPEPTRLYWFIWFDTLWIYSDIRSTRKTIFATPCPDLKMFEEVCTKKECMRRSDPGNVKETHTYVTLACYDDYYIKALQFGSLWKTARRYKFWLNWFTGTQIDHWMKTLMKICNKKSRKCSKKIRGWIWFLPISILNVTRVNSSAWYGMTWISIRMTNTNRFR